MYPKRQQEVRFEEALGRKLLRVVSGKGDGGGRWELGLRLGERGRRVETGGEYGEESWVGADEFELGTGWVRVYNSMLGEGCQIHMRMGQFQGEWVLLLVVWSRGCLIAFFFPISCNWLLMLE